jgi:hypothetical protein
MTGSVVMNLLACGTAYCQQTQDNRPLSSSIVTDETAMSCTNRICMQLQREWKDSQGHSVQKATNL